MRKSKSNARSLAQKTARERAAHVAPNCDAPLEQSTSASWTLGLALAVGVVTWFVFQPTLNGAWLRWDDDKLLLERSEWRGLGLENLAWMFTTFHMGPYQPLSWLSYAIDHAIGGMDARVYHRTNVVLHCASAVCLFLVARALFELALARGSALAADRIERPVDIRVVPNSRILQNGAATLTALVWALHPLRVESVAWITERRDCLSGLFLLLATLAWLAHVRRDAGRTRWYWLALVAFAASLLSKGLGLAFPLVLVILDVWPLQRFATHGVGARVRISVLEKWPFVAVALAAGVVAVLGQRTAGAMVDSGVHGLSARIVQSFYGLAFYVRKTLWPDDLMVLYPMRVPLDAGEARFVVAIVGVLIVAVVLFLVRRRAPELGVACACYAMLVAPVLGLVQTGSQLVADRYSYTSTLPLCICIGGLLLHTFRRGVLLGIAGGIVVALSIVFLARATAVQTHVWRDTLSLWKHDIAIDPTDMPARRSLAVEYEHRARTARTGNERRTNFENALAVARDGLALVPDAGLCAQTAKIHGQLAADEPERREQHLTVALEHALRAVEIVGRTGQRLPEAFESAGVILTEIGRADEALPYFAKLTEIDAASASRHAMYGEVLVQVGRVEQALVAFEKARRLDPTSTLVLLDLGDAHARLGDAVRAREAYQRVVDLKRAELGNAASSDADLAAAVRALSLLN
ncbi:MAG: tetratricopeptide repeat protein [Planctomycetota bacterium]|nr:tetratricopeptide repeat protein [Planctomycetota bacterium]